MILALLFISLSAMAQVDSPHELASPIHQWGKEGQLITIRITKGDPIRVFIVGREEAQINLSNLKVTIRRLKPYPGKVLSLDKYDNYFVIPDRKEFEKIKELEVQTDYQGKSETFRLELRNQVP